MPTVLSRTLGLLAMLGIAACDPAYMLGMRPRLVPPTTMDCIEATLRRSPRWTAVTRFDEEFYKGFSVVVSDTAVLAGQRPAIVQLDAGRDSTQTLSVAYHWMGFAGNVPLDKQQRMLEFATGALEELRVACAPAATAKVECFKGGFGGPSACRSG
jgi:hypothetical protein